MDNKQATSIQNDLIYTAELAYLAGIIDGEGWIGLQKRLQKRWITYKPALRVTNTDANIINKVRQVWEVIGVDGHIYENDQDPSVTNGKQIMNIQLNKQTDILRVLLAVEPFLVGKRARAQMLIRFLTKSIDREEAYQFIRTANKKGLRESSETTREAPDSHLVEDMAQTA